MSGSTSGFFTGVPAPDTSKGVGAYVVVIPAAGTAAVINPADDFSGCTIMNDRGANWVRATVTFRAGVTGNATAATQTQLIPPHGSVSFDLDDDVQGVTGSLAPIDSVTLESVALPVMGTAAVVEASTLTALTAGADASCVLNFVAV